jgi:hypothetical protein
VAGYVFGLGAIVRPKIVELPSVEDLPIHDEDIKTRMARLRALKAARKAEREHQTDKSD